MGIALSIKVRIETIWQLSRRAASSARPGIGLSIGCMDTVEVDLGSLL